MSRTAPALRVGTPWPALVAAPFVAHPLRYAVAVLAIAIGVALGLAVQLVNGAAVGEFAAAARQVAGDADLVVRGARAGFDESLYTAVARHPDVIVASPGVEIDAKLAGRDAVLALAGVDLFRASQLQPGWLADDADPLDLLRDDTVFLSATALTQLGVQVGDTIALQAGLGTVRLRVAGTLATGSGARGVLDIAAAQTHFGRLGRLTRIDVRLRDGVRPAAFAAALALPPGVVAERPEADGDTTARMTRAYRVNLNVLALVALFTGALLVFSTQALAVARRRAQLALLRVLGCTRGQVVALLLAEGAVVGASGALLGVAAGIGLAALALRFVGADLGAGVFRGIAPTLQIDPIATAVFGVCGFAAAVAGSVAPALEAARARPAAALKAGDDARAFDALRAPWPGVALLAAGAVAVLLPPVDGLPLFGYGAIAALLLGTILLLPRATRALLGLLPTLPGVPATLASARLRAFPAQAAVSLAAIVAAVSLMTAMAIMVASLRTSLVDWLDGILPADLYLRAGGVGDSAFLSPDDQARLRAIDGVGRIEFLRWVSLRLAAAQPPVVVLARDHVDADAEARLPLVSAIAPARDATPRAWISEPMAALHRLGPGDTLALPLGDGTTRFVVGGIWRDYARPAGAVLIDRARYIAATGDRTANDAGLWLAPGAAPGAVRAAVTALAPDGIERMTPADIRALSLQVFDRTFFVTYALEAVAVAIGLLGLSSAVGAEVLARRREFGMLRHIGVTRGEIARVLAFEGAAVGGVGLAVGGALGFAMSLILIHVVNRQSFHWGMTVDVPWGALATFAAALLGLATLTALASGRQALGADVVRAVKEDW
ncbi:MAG: FtsX-like permease family protein [Burkholderiales bacterium]|nr:FtsX-like permease family protein [Burkholderiales bacterium]